MAVFFCTSSFLALIILQPETVELNVTKSTGVARIFMQGGCKSDIMEFLYYDEL